MLDTLGSGPLLSPSLGIWELAWQAPDAGIVVVTVLFTLVTAGIGLAIFGDHRDRPDKRVAVVVQARRPSRRRRR